MRGAIYEACIRTGRITRCSPVLLKVREKAPILRLSERVSRKRVEEARHTSNSVDLRKPYV